MPYRKLSISLAFLVPLYTFSLDKSALESFIVTVVAMAYPCATAILQMAQLSYT